LTAEIISLPAPMEPEDVLEEAKSWGLTEVTVIGYDETGGFVWGGSDMSDAELLLLLEQAKHLHIRDMFEED